MKSICIIPARSGSIRIKNKTSLILVINLLFIGQYWQQKVNVLKNFCQHR